MKVFDVSVTFRVEMSDDDAAQTTREEIAKTIWDGVSFPGYMRPAGWELFSIKATAAPVTSSLDLKHWAFVKAKGDQS